MEVNFSMRETFCLLYAAGEAPITKSFSKSPKMPELLDSDNSRAYYFGRRAAEMRLFIEQKKLALPNYSARNCVKSIAL